MVSEAVKKYLKKAIENGESLRSISRRSGVDASTLSRVLSGERELTARHIDALADVLRLRVVASKTAQREVGG